MKKRILLSCIALCSVMMSAMAQRSYTFNAAALNVDGLPNQDISAVITTVNLNPDGKNEAGATEFCNILANSGWDIVGFSEDFNYHSYLAAAPASTYYNFGKHSGSITTNITQAFTRAEIDGLGIAVAKRLSFTGDTQSALQVQWEEEYGGSGLTSIGDNGADNMIAKGFRMYTITLATGVAVDVYVLHMDANTADSDDDYDSNGKDKNIVAREAQLKQLADYIKNNHNNRPVIVLGDTNCRYTREQLKTGFIDYINADSRFTIKDAWVEHMWGGTYPTYGAQDMTTGGYGDQKGEVVDKVFYINTTESNLTLKANSYLHDTSIAVSDHYPVVVNFTLTDPNGTPLTDAEKENNWTIVGGSAEKDNAITGCKVESGKTYFVKNVGSGTYLKSGATWGTQAAEGSAGMPITFELVNGNVYSLKTTLNGYIGHAGDTDNPDYPYMDVAKAREWTLTPVYGDDEKGYQYQITSTTGNALAIVSENHDVYCVAKDATSNRQKWVLLTEDDIRSQMAAATAEAPYDITPLLKAASFDYNNTENNTTNWGDGFSNYIVGGVRGGAPTDYECCAVLNSTPNVVTISQTISNLPKGNYTFTGQGFYRYQEKRTKSNKDTYTEKTMDVTVTVGKKSTKLQQNTTTAIGTNAEDPARLFKDGNYNFTLSPSLDGNGDLTVQVSKPSTTSDYSSGWLTKTYYYYYNWVCIDNFKLVYTGDGSDGGVYDPNKEYKEQVLAKVNETYPKVMALNEAGQAAYDITTVVSRYNNDQITSPADAKALCNIVDAAYNNAYAAHRTYLVENAYNNLGADGDISVVIVNPSFETGDLTGWTVFRGAQDTGVTDKQNATGMDGSYLFNTWDNQGYGCGIIYQEITGLRNGHYTLQAMVTSWEDRKVYIVGNDQYVGVATTQGAGTFVNLALDFLVENGTARIGAVGGNEGNDFYYKQGIFYKVDHFRLAYKGDVGQGRVEIALAKAKAEADKLGEVAKAQFYNAVAQYENASVSGDGKAEEAAIYAALKAAVATQPIAGTNMTWLITNPGFETGDWTGWTKPTAWDGVVLHATHNNAPANGEGQYIVNVWNDQQGIENSGINQPVYQKLTGLPNGRYCLTADVASDGGNQVCVYATAGNQTVNGAASPENNWTFVEASVEFEVTDGTATIGAVGYRNGEFNIEGGCWYKCDNFRLTYVAPIAVEKVTLDKTTATIVENETLTLTATVTPDYATDKTVTWSSSDDKIATVDQNGKITAKVPGTVTITATSGDKSASCAVTVDYASYVFTLNVEGAEYFKKDVKRNTNLAAVMEAYEVAMPTKTGYTFSDWELPEVMPAKDLTLNGTYTINSYKVIFKIGEEFFDEKELEYGADIVAPEAPAKEGHTFDGWGEVAKTVPAEDVTYTGSYTVNKYTVTFQIGEDVISSVELEYGAAIEAPEAPAKEGYTFNGWGEVAATVPAEDVVYEGSYTVNKYTVTFKIGDEFFEEKELEYGATIEAPKAPEKTGYTFDGWGEVAATVPVDGATYVGSYTVNKYTVTFKIGEEVISEVELDYGATIVAPEAPEKTGHTFNGWGEVAATVPVDGATYEGSYTVNKYTVSYYFEEELVHTAEIEFGAEIPEYIYDVSLNIVWKIKDEEQDYTKMPAKNLVYVGELDTTGLDRLSIDSNAVIYDLCGRRVLEAVKGFYIINGKKVFVK